MSLVSYWSIVPVFLKPDALEGENSVMPGRRAADFAMFLAAGLDEPDRLAYDPCFPESAAGAGLARRHVAGESGAFSWYEWPPADVPGCQRRLAELHAEWAGLPSVDVPRIVTRASAALGFEVTQVTDMILTLDDYMVFYGDTPRPDLHPRMQRYLVDRPIRLLMMCGKQQNSALQAMKTYLRRVLVHHSGRSSDGGNLIHVTNPDASNYPSSCASTCGRPSRGQPRAAQVRARSNTARFAWVNACSRRLHAIRVPMTPGSAGAVPGSASSSPQKRAFRSWRSRTESTRTPRSTSGSR